jgi:hypothetical protein
MLLPVALHTLNQTGVYWLRPAVSFQIKVGYQLRPSLLTVKVLVASRSQF